MPLKSESSSDDEGEASVTPVSDYSFEDENDLSVSFSVLPLRAVRNETPREITLYGTVDNGLRKISKQVVAWNYDLSRFVSGALISVLIKDGKWIVLLGKPSKWYGNGEGRSILVTLECLHFLRRNPEVSDEAVWNHMAKTFSFPNVTPNPGDLIPHVDLIADAVKNDCFLSKSKFLRSFLENPEKNANHPELKVVSEFIVDDTVDYDYEPCINDNEESEEGELYDSVCAFCDNGGFVLCCDGVCMRAFHAKGEAESHCGGLGLSKRDVDAIQTFVCKNCKSKKHQCFCCGKLGISDKSKGPEVFRCSNAFCGHFYHPGCIAKLLKPEDELAQELLVRGIPEGESFICTIHKCAVCQGGEKKNEIDFQFAVCRRCPTAYHRKCLPREIHFAKTDDEEHYDVEREEENDVIIYRAWENLLPNRVLMYCLKHDIIEKLGTPARGHVIFPEVIDPKVNNSLERPKRAATLVRKRYNETVNTFQTKRQRSSEKSSTPSKKLKTQETECFSETLRKTPELDKTPPRKGKSLPPEGEKSSLVDATNNSVRTVDYSTRKRKIECPTKPHDLEDNTSADKISELQIQTSASLLTEESKRRIMTLMKKSELEVSSDDILTKRQIPSVYSHSLKNMIEKVVTLGKIEGAVEAVRAALNKAKNGSTVEEVKAVCEPEVLNQIFKWQSKLKVYLSPFLHGSRYTSYGRHFTKVEKLDKIANILLSYVQSGDMIVDFCCGANDFSCGMRKKLEEHGKKCLFKNYDIIQAKNPFNFEKRDWMTVEPHELIDGGKLIIGLNPPFGAKAALANKFINKALEFKPKLLILIVPRDTERPNQKTPPYDLIWENSALCSDKSFYLPGNEPLLDQWNLNTPTLVLWSRRDWTGKYASIAKIHSHCEEKGGKVQGGREASDEKNGIRFVNVDYEDGFVEKRTDAAGMDIKTQPSPSTENSGRRKRPAHVSVPRGICVDYEDRFKEKRTDVARTDINIPPMITAENSGRRKRPSHVSVPRGISVNYEDGFVENRIDVGRTDKKIPRLTLVENSERPAHVSVPRGISVYTPRFPQMPSGISVDSCARTALPPYPLPHRLVPKLCLRDRVAGFRQQLGSLQQNPAASGVPRQIPYPNMKPELRRRVSATERYASQLNDLSFDVGVGRFGTASLASGMHLRQPYNGDSIPYPHPHRYNGNSSSLHKDNNPNMPNNL